MSFSVTPAQPINVARTAASAAASSTANPWTPGANVISYQAPGAPVAPLVAVTQGFSTQLGQVFTDFCSGNLQTQQTYALVEGSPTID